MGQRRWTRSQLNDRIFSVGLVIPALVLLSFTIIIPIIDVIRMSFLDYNLLRIKSVIWNNFEKEFILTFLRTLYFVFTSVALEFVLGLVCALILHQGLKGSNVFKGALFLPWTIPMLIVGVVWMWIYQPQYGILNYIVNNVFHITREKIGRAHV